MSKDKLNFHTWSERNSNLDIVISLSKFRGSRRFGRQLVSVQQTEYY